MTPSDRALTDAVESLYATFANYRIGAVTGCPCCVSDEARDALRAVRLRELGDAALGGFAFSALNTWGDLTDFKHFLPRILELSARGELWVDLQITYGKLVQEGPWSDAEKAALERFTQAHVRLVLDPERPARAPSFATVIESAGVARMDVVRLLDVAISSPRYATAFARFVLDEASSLASPGRPWIWWKDEEDVVARWLLSGRARAFLTATFEAAPDAPDAGTWAEASDVLEALGA